MSPLRGIERALLVAVTIAVALLVVAVGAAAASPPAAGAPDLGPNVIVFDPVSYTHLTLPTIYSV